ncbi:unnamed protein product [Dovyalis caffra]|uniref:Uncharacterized protein n=1 Tax=Dovyalis caffra TaxID=77055 RepID=A0AAV1SB29_9ROSI|nr:unnamed protein product [Dovyalis caffra]
MDRAAEEVGEARKRQAAKMHVPSLQTKICNRKEDYDSVGLRFLEDIKVEIGKWSTNKKGEKYKKKKVWSGSTRLRDDPRSLFD